jgi:aminoglycoside/choline kinase family phosphotransferase
VNPVAATAADLTASWLSAALDREVTSVRCEPIGTGRIGASYRLSLTYCGVPRPATLIAKLAAGDAAARQAVAKGYATEVGFYTELAGKLAVRTPRCWYAAIDADETNFTLLLEDLAPAIPGVQAHGCSVESAAAALQNLARLHAAHWDNDSLFNFRFIGQPTPEVAQLLGTLVRDATPGFIDRHEAALGERDAETLNAVAEAISAWMLGRPRPFTLVHGDYRLDNLMFPPEGSDVVALDWQTLTIGQASRDVSYFLGTSLPTDVRRAHEHDLVWAYHAALVTEGVSRYDVERCWDDYRWGHLQGPMITVLGAMRSPATRDEGADEMFVAMATRSCAAIRDLESLDLV